MRSTTMLRSSPVFSDLSQSPTTAVHMPPPRASTSLFLTQCAAVTTHLGERRTPPHQWPIRPRRCELNWIDTCHGHAPLCASSPRIIRASSPCWLPPGNRLVPIDFGRRKFAKTELTPQPLWSPPLTRPAQSTRTATLATRTHIAKRVFQPQATYQPTKTTKDHFTLPNSQLSSVFGKSGGQKWISHLDYLMICAPSWSKRGNH